MPSVLVLKSRWQKIAPKLFKVYLVNSAFQSPRAQLQGEDGGRAEAGGQTGEGCISPGLYREVEGVSNSPFILVRSVLVDSSCEQADRKQI